MKRQLTSILGLVLIPILVLSVCSDNKTTNPIDAFSPEIINNIDAFEFQITDAENVNTTVEYSWENTAIAASVDQSCAITQGSAIITIFDADNTEVYTRDLSDGGSYPSQEGTAGTWTISVVFENVSGTVNFRAEAM